MDGVIVGLLVLVVLLVLVAAAVGVLAWRRDPAAKLAVEIDSRMGVLRADLERVERALRDE